MKHLIFVALLTILSIQSYSQVVFENGYLINDTDQRINCLIRNYDWKNNPSEIEYKISQNDSVHRVGIPAIKEFGINGISRYIKAKVKIDRSSDELDNLTTERNPVFLEESLFLKVLIEGKASLYIYEEGNLKRFFFKADDASISQLVYKRYLIDGSNFSENNMFRQQLFTNLKCPAIPSSNFESIKYYKKDLKNLFIKYYECINSTYVDFEPKQKKDLFNLTFRPGLNLSSFVVQSITSNPKYTDFGSKSNFRFGIETEFILPYNKNKLSAILEPTFQQFTSEVTISATGVVGGILNAKVKYQSIEVPIGFRHYFFLNDKSKIFVNLSYIFDFSSNSYVQFTRTDGSLYSSTAIKSRSNFGVGVGQKYKDKYSIEIRYHTSRELLGYYGNFTSDYRTLSFILGYSIF